VAPSAWAPDLFAQHGRIDGKNLTLQLTDDPLLLLFCQIDRP
jgi:hypothetical protein